MNVLFLRWCSYNWGIGLHLNCSCAELYNWWIQSLYRMISLRRDWNSVSNGIRRYNWTRWSNYAHLLILASKRGTNFVIRKEWTHNLNMRHQKSCWISMHGYIWMRCSRIMMKQMGLQGNRLLLILNVCSSFLLRGLKERKLLCISTTLELAYRNWKKTPLNGLL